MLMNSSEAQNEYTYFRTGTLKESSRRAKMSLVEPEVR